MKSRDLFGVLLRVLGVLFLFVALDDLGHSALQLLGVPITSRYSPTEDAVGGLFWIALGILMLATTSLTTRLLYGRENN